MSIPNRLRDLLEERHVPYQLLSHPRGYTARQLARSEGISECQHAKVVMVKTNGQHRMTVLPTDRRVDLRKLEEATGEHWDIEEEGDFSPLFPDCEIGTMPPFGELYDVSMYVDRSLAENDDIVFEAGTHTDAVRMKYRDYEALAHPVVADFATLAA